SWQLLAGIDPRDTLSCPYVDAEPFQIAPQRRPQATVVVISRHIEEQPFRRAKKVAMKHGDQLTGGELIRMGKETAGEHLQPQVSSPSRKPKAIKEFSGPLPVVPGERRREFDVQQLEGSRHVHRTK